MDRPMHQMGSEHCRGADPAAGTEYSNYDQVVGGNNHELKYRRESVHGALQLEKLTQFDILSCIILPVRSIDEGYSLANARSAKNKC